MLAPSFAYSLFNCSRWIAGLVSFAIWAWVCPSKCSGAPADAMFSWGVNHWGQTEVPDTALSNLVDIAAGERHTVALRADGTAVAWGHGNAFGDGPSPVVLGSNIVEVAAGYGQTAIRRSDGSIAAWGSWYSQPPKELTNGVTALAVGEVHILALKSDGTIKGWGSSNTPDPRTPPAGLSNFVAISAGQYHSLALKADGSVVAWGWNEQGQASVPQSAQSDVVRISAGALHNLALTSQGAVVAWGDNSHGQIDVPEEARSGVIEIAAGFHHSMALKGDGSVVVWGHKFSGLPRVPPTVRKNVRKLVSGAYHAAALVAPESPAIVAVPTSLALSTEDPVSFSVEASGHALRYQWSKNGIPIDGATNPFLALGPARPDQTGAYTVVVSNHMGSVTSSPATLTVEPRPAGSAALLSYGADPTGLNVPEVALSGVVHLAATRDYLAAVKENGTVVTWGRLSRVVPEEARFGIVEVAAGDSDAISLKSDGSVVSWANQTSSRPPSGAASGVVAIAAGQSHYVALKNDGSLVVWGTDLNGNITLPTPTPSGIVAISAGWNHTLALRNDGRVIAWGNSSSGEVSVPLLAQSGVIAISANDRTSSALRADGTVVIWGDSLSHHQVIPKKVSPETKGLVLGRSASVLLGPDGTPTIYGTNHVETREASLGGIHSIRAGFDYIAGVVLPEPPTIVAQPVSLAKPEGELAHFTVRAGGYPLSFQWRRDGLDIAAATNSTINFGPLHPSFAGNYSVVISNQFGSITSAPNVSLVVEPPTRRPGTVIAWGADSYGQSTVPEAASEGIVQVALSASRSWALTSEGSVVSWGQYTNLSPAIRSNVVQIAVAWDYLAALHNDGSVSISGTYGTNLPAWTQTGVTKIAAGGGKLLVLKHNGTVLQWDGTHEASEAVPMDAQSDVVDIVAAQSFFAALKADGSTVCWNGPVSPRSAVRSGVTAIMAGGQHLAAVKLDGSVVVWGDGLYVTNAVPSSASNMVSLASDSNYAVAIKSDGSFLVWGRQKIGDGWTQPFVPDAVRAAHVTDMVIGPSHSLAIIQPAAPRIVIPPTDQSSKERRPTSFAVVARGYPLAYQWTKNGNPIENATNAVLNLGPVWQSDSANYSVIVTNRLGVATAPAARLDVAPVPNSGVVAWGANDKGQINTPAETKSNVVAIAAGSTHTLALKDDGSVVAWGDNQYGQTQVPVSAQSGVVFVAAGEDRSAALKDDGSIVVWGFGGTETNTFPADTQIADMVVTRRYLLTLDQSGRVAVIPGRSTYSAVTNVPKSALSGIRAVRAGNLYAALRFDGSVVGWAESPGVPDSQLHVPEEPLKALSAGQGYMLGILTNGSVVSWGANAFGVRDVPDVARSNVVDVAAGNGFALGLGAGGRAFEWGGEYESSPSKTKIPDVLRNRVEAVSAGGSHAVALVALTAPVIVKEPSNLDLTPERRGSLTVEATGYPVSFQWRRNGTNLPGATGATLNFPPGNAGLIGAYDVVVSNAFGRATSTIPAEVSFVPQTRSTIVIGWGANHYGQAQPSGGPLLDVRAIAAGGAATFAVGWDGKLHAWGRNDRRQCSLPNTVSSNMISVAAGNIHALALNNYGRVITWGDLASSAGQPLAAPTNALNNVVAIAAGYEFSLALKSDGSVLAWGFGSPVLVPAAAKSGVVEIAAGGRHALALKWDGAVIAWGDNTAGESTVPEEAKRDIVAVAAGAAYSLALTKHGKVIAWGNNALGQIAVPIDALDQVIRIGTGVRHSFALRNDGLLVSWGDNQSGQCDIPARALFDAASFAAGADHSLAVVNLPPPAMSAIPGAGGVSISWPAIPRGFLLQSASILEPFDWQFVSGTNTQLNGSNRVTIPADDDARFFRLFKPSSP